jgi:hypothetical protein
VKNPVLGTDALWTLGRTLGLPDELPVYSIRIVAEVDSVVNAEVGLRVSRDQLKQIEDWLNRNRDDVAVNETVVLTPG